MSTRGNKHYQILLQLTDETGRDYSSNRGMIAFLSSGLNQPAIKTIYLAFLRAGIDANKARTAAVICANKHFNGGQMPGFGGTWLNPAEQLKALEESSEQALKTFHAIRDRTKSQYSNAIYRIILLSPKPYYSHITEDQVES